MKTKEELNAIKNEVEAVRNKLNALTDDELAQVSGGAYEESFFWGYYQCPYCHKEHRFKLTWGLSGNFYNEFFDECDEVYNLCIEEASFTSDITCPIKGKISVISSRNTIVVPFRSTFS